MVVTGMRMVLMMIASALATAVAVVVGAAPAIAQEMEFLAIRGDGDDGLDQVTSVSQLSDVQPTDWAFQALQSLVERYGCIAGYPDGTFRGNRALTRYEFAAGLNACLAKVEELISTASADLATKADLQTLQRLQEEFAAELATLRGRVDALEARASELEANQFSTTTKLEGNVIFSLHGGDLEGSDREQIAFGQRTRLLFNTSFSGEDLLVTRLESNTVQSPVGDVTGLGSLSYGDGEDTSFGLTFLGYSFPLGDRLSAIVGATGLDIDDTHPVHNNFLYGDGSGALSAFGDRNPVLRQPADAGFGLMWDLSDTVNVNVGYYAGNAASPDLGNGLFNGSYSANVSVNYTSANGRLGAGLFYAHSYYSRKDFGGDEEIGLMGGVGTAATLDPFGGRSVISDNVGFQANYLISDRLAVNGWFGYTHARNASDRDQHLDATTWAVALTFPDLFKEGSFGALMVGQPPAVVDARGAREDDERPLHVEALYRFALNDNVSITPGAIAVFNAEEDETAVIGVLRTEFAF